MNAKQRKRLEEAIMKYLTFWRTKDNKLSNPIHAESLKNSFRAGALWQLEESKMETYLLCFEAYKVSNTTHTDEQTLLMEFNEWYIKQLI